MNVTEKETPVFRFESYTADLRSGELRKFGTRIPLQIQPFQQRLGPPPSAWA